MGSRYASKVRRKHGRGRVEPEWMWWMERVDEVRANGAAAHLEGARITVRPVARLPVVEAHSAYSEVP